MVLQYLGCSCPGITTHRHSIIVCVGLPTSHVMPGPSRCLGWGNSPLFSSRQLPQTILKISAEISRAVYEEKS